MAIIKSLAVLKLASTFCNSKDHRAICGVVKINHLEDGFSEVVASNGHTLIKITSKLLSLEDYNFSLIKMDSIAKACKVNEKHLLLHADEIRYPNYNRVLEVPHVYEAESASFNINYMAKIFTALNTFCKDLKIKLKPVTIGPLRKKESNVLLAELRDGEGNDIKIEVAIMPMLTGAQNCGKKPKLCKYST